ncbi:MAG TPA: hypothetical protein PLI97_06040 [Fluviicola sp.]|nr:hypothetical protein [Fluviicola sp.]
MKHNFIILSFLLLLLCACNKSLVSYNSDFEGTWFSTPVYNPDFQKFVSDELVFSGKTGTYQSDCADTCSTNLCECTNKITGTAEINDSRSIIRLNGQIKRTFTVIQEPYQQDGKWFMKLDNKVYQKQ